MEELRPPVHSQPVNLWRGSHVGHRRQAQTSAYNHRGQTYCSQSLVVTDVDISIVLQESAHALLLSGTTTRRLVDTSDVNLFTS